MTTSDPLAPPLDTFWTLMTRGSFEAAEWLLSGAGMGLFDLSSAAPTASTAAAPTAPATPTTTGDSAAPAARSKPARVPARVQAAQKPRGQWLRKRFEHAAGTHEYRVYVPSSSRSRPAGLIVMLHGANQGADDFAAGTGMNEVADAKGYVVVYPEQPESVNLFRCWNWFRPADQIRDSGEPAVIAGITRQALADHHVDASRVYVAGMSAGGAMAVNMVIAYPELYAGAAIHSGMAYGVADEPIAALCAMNDGLGKLRLPQPTGAASTRPTPLIVFHGDLDNTVHPKNGDLVMEMHRVLAGQEDAAHATLRVEAGQVEDGHAYSRHLVHDAAGRLIAEHWVIHGLDHAWSGGHRGGTFTDARGPHASREIVRFFEAVSDAA